MLGVLMRKIIIAASIAIACIVFVAAIINFRSGVVVIVRNVGSEPLHSVIVHVTGNSYQIGDIDVGATKKVKVVAQGESHVEIEHGNQKRLVVDCYFESVYKGKIIVEVTSDQVVNVKQDIRTGPL